MSFACKALMSADIKTSELEHKLNRKLSTGNRDGDETSTNIDETERKRSSSSGNHTNVDASALSKLETVRQRKRDGYRRRGVEKLYVLMKILNSLPSATPEVVLGTKNNHIACCTIMLITSSHSVFMYGV